MPTQRFPLEPNAPERLSITSGPFAFSKATIALDGKVLLADLKPQQLQDGVSMALPDGSSLSVRRRAANLLKSDQAGLELKRNGIPLPGSIGTPEHALKIAKGAGMFLYVLAGLNVAFGMMVMLLGQDPLFAWNTGGAWPIFMSALLLAVLGFFVHRRLSLIALGIAMGFLIVDGFVSAVLQGVATGRPAVGGVIMRAFFAIFLFGAFKVIRRYKATQRPA